MNNIYVGNLSYDTDEYGLKELFSTYGQVETVRIITDRDTKRSKGFAFVEMSEKTEAEHAINALDGKEVDGRRLKVNEAREKKESRHNGDGGRRYGQNTFGELLNSRY